MEQDMRVDLPGLMTRFLLLALAFAMTGCASSGKLRSDYDRDADFGAYETYNFVDHGEDDEYESLFHQYMVDAITLEMENRGYVKSDDPDLLVNFNAIIEDKTKVSTRPATPPPMYGGYYGYRGGFYDPWYGYGYGTETHVSQYTEGTFNIDLVDARQKRLVWEAVGIGRITDSTYENLEERVREGVPRFFALYPFVAGDPNPRPTE
jgi:hypothetical protein